MQVHADIHASKRARDIIDDLVYQLIQIQNRIDLVRRFLQLQQFLHAVRRQRSYQVDGRIDHASTTGCHTL